MCRAKEQRKKRKKKIIQIRAQKKQSTKGKKEDAD